MHAQRCVIWYIWFLQFGCSFRWLNEQYQISWPWQRNRVKKYKLQKDLAYINVWRNNPCHPSKIMQSARILWSPLALLNILYHIHRCATLSTICCIGIFNGITSRHICMPCRCCNTTQVLKFLIKLTIIWTGFWLAKIQSKHITSQEEYNIT